MKKFFIIIFTLIFIAGCENEFKVPALTGRVVDTAKILSNEDKNKIENAILNFEKNTNGQFAVCIIPSLKDESIESASIKIAEKWKIGNKDKDDGIIFVLAKKEREFRIEVGYGYEGQINDAKAGDLGRLAIPSFKKEKWSDGIVIIINGCSDIITGKKNPVASLKENEDDNEWIRTAIIVAAIIIVVFIVVKLEGNSVFISTGGGFGGGSSSGGFGGHGGGFGGGGFSGKF